MYILVASMIDTLTESDVDVYVLQPTSNTTISQVIRFTQKWQLAVDLHVFMFSLENENKSGMSLTTSILKNS